MRRVLLAVILSVMSGLAGSWYLPAQGQTPAAEPVTYDQVRPVFRKHCVTCHNQDRARGDLNLSSLDGIKAGSSSGAAVVARKPEESPIYLLAAHLEDPQMPPNSPKIPQRELDLIRRWIEGGLVERGAIAAASPPPKEPVSAVAAPALASAPRAKQKDAAVAIEPLARPAPITALAVSPTAPLVAVSGRKQVVLFQWTDQKPLQAFAFPEGDVFALRFSADGALLLAGGGVGGLSGKVVGFEVATGKRLFELGDETDVVLATDISPEGTLVALGGPSRSVKIFRVADGELVTTLRKHTDWVLSLAFSPEGLLLASSDRFGGLQVWEARSGKEFHTLRGHVGPVNALRWSADSERLLSAGDDGSVRHWNMHDGSQVTRGEGDVGGILAADYNAAGRFACGGRDGRITIWDAAGKQLQRMSLSDEVAELGLTHDAAHIVAGDAAGNLAVFRLETGELAGRFQLPLAPASLLAKTSLPLPPKSPPADKHSSPLSPEVAAAEAEAQQAAADLAVSREASLLAESALTAAEQSLEKLRESATKLRTLVASRDAAAKQAAQRAADVQARAESLRKLVAASSTDLERDREQLNQRLAERRSLHEAAAAVAERIQAAAAASPADAGLQGAIQLATDLQNKLSAEVEVASVELRRVELALRGMNRIQSVAEGK